MKEPKVDLRTRRSGSQILDDLYASLKVAEARQKQANKEESDNKKKLVRCQEIVDDLKRIIADKKSQLNIR
ncbi:MAG: hypothetical protein IKL14_02480 [Alphaproteobacteria bacterium]|nr:hypothetical protein [Alphaproteobacteria bacterium]